jgi:hypothetical protein
MRRRALPIAAAVLVVLAACARESRKSGATSPQGGDADATPQPCLRIVNGKTSVSREAIVLLLYVDGATQVACTGTFVGDDVLVTASHCVHDAGGKLRYVKGSSLDLGADPAAAYASGKEPVKVLDPAQIASVSAASLAASAHDLAVLVFAERTAPATLPLAKTEAADGAEIALVGYGRTSVDGALDPKLQKRFGVNTVHASDALKAAYPDVALVFGPSADDGGGGGRAVFAIGDHGAPALLEDDSVAGVASASGTPPAGLLATEAAGQASVAGFASTRSAFALDLFDEAKAAGASFSATATAPSDDNTGATPGSPGNAPTKAPCAS